VISYQQVLLAEGSEAAFAQHILWGTLLLFLCIYGSGLFSIDHWLRRLSLQTEETPAA